MEVAIGLEVYVVSSCFDNLTFSFSSLAAIIRIFILLKLCVSKCPDRFATYIDMQSFYRYNKSYWEYYRQFCKPGFKKPGKVSSASAMPFSYQLPNELRHGCHMALLLSSLLAKINHPY